MAMDHPQALPSLDAWTSALLTKSSAGRGSNGKLEAYGIKKLRELILELAVRGKLVPQDPNDEPASVLLEKIAKEKLRLIKEGKIKQEKPLADVDAMPFELPESWEWARLPSIASYLPGKTPSTKNPSYWSENPVDVPWVSISDMEHLAVLTETSKKITPEAAKHVFGYEPISKGSLLMSFKLTVGKMAILGVDAYHNEAILSIQPYSGIVRDYLLKVLPTRAQAGNTKRAIMGDTLNSTSLALLLIPVPPLAEQHRIVAKVDELMALCDQLEQQQTDSLAAHQTLVETLLGTLTRVESQQEFSAAWARIASHFGTLFTTEASIEQLKQTLLQLAVMGKLVPQDPNDEPASVLLKRLAKQKEQKIEHGALKKGKPYDALNGDEKPFELPMSWAWSTLPEIGELARGKSKHRPRNDPKLYSNGTIPMVQTGDVSRADPFISSHTALYNETGLSQSRLWPKGTMCITIAANIAETGILAFNACFPDSVVGFIPFDEGIDVKYFEYFMRTAKGHLEDFAPSTAQKNINLDILGQLLVPLPPARELGRIVAKVDELMALCDALKARLADAQTTQIHLADAIVEQAVC